MKLATLPCILLLFMSRLWKAEAFPSEKVLEEAKRNITLATIFQLIERDTNRVFPTDLHKSTFINHFQIILDSLLRENVTDSEFKEDAKEKITIADEREEFPQQTNDRDQFNASPSGEISKTGLSEKDGGHPFVSSTVENKNNLVNVNDASVWELFKLQVQNDFAPFLLLIPNPIKIWISQEVSVYSQHLQNLIGGALSLMMPELSRLFSKAKLIISYSKKNLQNHDYYNLFLERSFRFFSSLRKNKGGFYLFREKGLLPGQPNQNHSLRETPKEEDEQAKVEREINQAEDDVEVIEI